MIPADELYTRALSTMDTARMNPRNPRDLTQDDLFITLDTPENRERFKKNYDSDILSTWLEVKPGKLGSPNRDKNHMEHFLKNNVEGRLPIIEGHDLVDYLPGEAPLIYYLRADALHNTAGWQFPSFNYIESLRNRSSVDMLSLDGVDVRELTIGVADNAEMDDVFDWVMKNIKDNKSKFPAEFLSFDVESFPIPQTEYDRLLELKDKHRDRNITHIFKVPSIYSKNLKQIPARMILGDGITWFLSLRFDFKLCINPTTKRRTYEMTLQPIPKKVIHFLETLPPLVGLGVIEDRRDIEETIFNLFDIRFPMPLCLELDSIALALGWKLPRTNMFTMNLITMGSLMNKEVSLADQSWPLEWDELPDSLKLYCIADVRFGYSTYIVLTSLLIRNMFPDPDVFCSTLELRQEDAIEWFAWMMLSSIGETKLKNDERMTATTRQDLVKCLRSFQVGQSNNKRMKPEPSSKTIAFAQLIPDWPNVTSGGARNLQTVRAKFVFQFHVLQSMGISHARLEPNLMKTINPDLIRSITFGRGINMSDVGEGVRSDQLQNHPDFEGKVYKLESTDLSDAAIRQQAAQTGQGKVLGILEWARLNPDNINHLLFTLKQMNMDTVPKPIWFQKTFIYERLRMMHMFLYNTPAPVVPTLAEEIRARYQRVRAAEEQAKARDQRILSNRIRRENLYDAQDQMIQDGALARTGAQNKIFDQIPGDKYERNQKWKKAKARKINRIKRLGTFYPKSIWKEMGKKGDRPNRNKVDPNVPDLREHLNQRYEDEEVILETHEHGHQSGPYTEEYSYETVTDLDDPVPGPSGIQREVSNDYVMYRSGVPFPIPSAMVYGKPTTQAGLTQPSTKKYGLPPGMDTESSEDEIDNAYVTSQMMNAGFYPKRKKTGFNRYQTL